MAPVGQELRRELAVVSAREVESETGQGVRGSMPAVVDNPTEYDPPPAILLPDNDLSADADRRQLAIRERPVAHENGELEDLARRGILGPEEGWEAINVGRENDAEVRLALGYRYKAANLAKRHATQSA